VASDYSFTSPTISPATTATITPRAITSSASIGGTLSKVYDGSTSASGATVSGSVAGGIATDTLTLDTGGETLVYNTAHVLTANSIGATGTGKGADGSSGTGGLTHSDNGDTKESFTDSGNESRNGTGTGITSALRMSLVKVATSSETGMLLVFLPSATKATSVVFTFKLPAQIIDGVPASVLITVTMADGSALPSWLNFDVSARIFSAASVPPGTLPMRVIVNIGDRKYSVDIVESSS
jgi:hypothetical protein